MTKEEALSFFKGDIEDIDDLFDEQLFELKNQLLSIVPINKIVYTRIKKIEQLSSAYSKLSEYVFHEEYVQINYNFNQNILDSYLNYQDTKGKLRLQLLNSLLPENIILYAIDLVKLELAFAINWKSEIIDEKCIVSKQPDPMNVLSAIREYNTIGGITFGDLKSTKNNPPELLIQERNRLSLLVSKYSEI